MQKHIEKRTKSHRGVQFRKVSGQTYLKTEPKIGSVFKYVISKSWLLKRKRGIRNYRMRLFIVKFDLWEYDFKWPNTAIRKTSTGFLLTTRWRVFLSMCATVNCQVFCPLVATKCRLKISLIPRESMDPLHLSLFHEAGVRDFQANTDLSLRFYSVSPLRITSPQKACWSTEMTLFFHLYIRARAGVEFRALKVPTSTCSGL